MLGRRTQSLGQNILKSQLSIAQQRIASLEGYIQNREREFQSTVSRSQHVSSVSGAVSPVLQGRNRRRRMGRTHANVLLSTRSIESVEEEHERNDDSLSVPLGEFISLKIINAVSNDEAMPIPFVVRRLIGRVYHIGPEGVIIGTSPSLPSSSSSRVSLPAESQMEREHFTLKSAAPDSNGKFILKDLTNKSGLSIDHMSSHMTTSEEGVLLSSGVRFTTGIIVWEVTALPRDIELTAKLFHLTELRDVIELKQTIEAMEPATSTIPSLTITGAEDTTPINASFTIFNPVTPLTSYDINTEYKAPSYEEDEKYNNLFSTSSRKPSQLGGALLARQSVPVSKSHHKPCLMLHIAIDNDDEEMTRYLLSRGANVNKSGGELGYTAVHYAALRNNDKIMSLLLQYGGDMEIRNNEHLPPLALTTSYTVRKLILNSILLCATADAGDMSEVTRLLSTTPTSPNVLGLRHKNALHLSSAKGYPEIVELLIMNGVDVNMKGGTRQRTALHYASSNGHASIVQLLLSSGAQEFVRDIGGYTALNLCQGEACHLLHSKPMSLCIAVQSGDADRVSKILEELHDKEEKEEEEEEDIINLRNDQNHAPLHLACIIGSMELVQLLVSYGALIGMHGGSDGWTPLFYAAIAGHIDIVQFLLSVGANCEEEDNDGITVRERVLKVIEETEECMTRLKQRNRSESVVEASLFPQRSVNMLRQESAPSCSVETQLEWQATKLNKLQTVLSLLTTPTEKLLAALNDKNLDEFISLLQSGVVSPDVLLDGVPVLAQVCDDGLYGFAKALLDHGAKACLNGSTSQIPVLAAASNGNVPLLKLLMEYGADINAKSTTDTLSTALHEAAAINSGDTVKYLLSIGANKGNTNHAGELPFDSTNDPEIRKLLAIGSKRLLVAAMEDDTAAITELINDKNIPVDTEFYHNGYTALHQSCDNGNNETVKLLIDLGADVNKKGGMFSQSPLHIASCMNHINIAKILIENGAKLDIKDSEGKVPFEVATTNQMRKVLVEARKAPSLLSPPSSEGRSSSNGQLCLICMDNPINTIILPCGHQTFCKECVTQITQCALDRQPIREVVPIFR